MLLKKEFVLLLFWNLCCQLWSNSQEAIFKTPPMRLKDYGNRMSWSLRFLVWMDWGFWVFIQLSGQDWVCKFELSGSSLVTTAKSWIWYTLTPWHGDFYIYCWWEAHAQGQVFFKTHQTSSSVEQACHSSICFVYLKNFWASMFVRDSLRLCVTIYINFSSFCL